MTERMKEAEILLFLADRQAERLAEDARAALRGCVRIGREADSLRDVHARCAELCREWAGTPRDGEDPQNALFFTGVVLAALSFQAAHEGAWHLHAVVAVATSIIRQGAVSEEDQGCPLRGELRNGMRFLLQEALEGDGKRFFAACPEFGEASLRIKALWASRADREPAALSELRARGLSAGAEMLAVCHERFCGRDTCQNPFHSVHCKNASTGIY